MAEGKLCEPCRALLAGERKDRKLGHDADHHPDTESFTNALQLSCDLCSFAWSQCKHSIRPPPELPKKTKNYMLNFKEENADMDTRMLRFHYSLESPLASIILAPWHSMNSYVYPDLLSDNTGSASAIQFLLRKYNECRDKHEQCRLWQSPTSSYPSRLIDVGIFADECIYLRDTGGFIDQGPYFCLSHCWGKTQPYSLTDETSSTLRGGLPITALPKTFQDAIVVTRSFGVRYLWVDSLCIYQDNIHDWATEASHMRDVYSQAACTIAATAARGSNEGLFFDRDPTLIRPLRINATWTPETKTDEYSITYPSAGTYWADHEELWTKCVEEAPLNTRAWVAQERHLSPRILHFTARQVFWECHECKACENYPDGLPGWALPTWTHDTGMLKRQLNIYRHQKQRATLPSNAPFSEHQPTCSYGKVIQEYDLHHYWSSFLIVYSSCALSKEQDKLVAILGIAQDFGQALGDELVAGLWKSRLLEELCWLRKSLPFDRKDPGPSKWRAPTWSWASNNHRAWVSNTTKFHRSCPSRQIWPQLEDLDIETKPSGELERASIRIRCRPMRALIRCVRKPKMYDGVEGWCEETATLEKTNAELNCESGYESDRMALNWDNDLLPETYQIHMIVIQRCAHDEPLSTFAVSCIEGLMLLPREDSEDIFERLGTFTAQGECIEMVIKEYEAAEEKVITLV